MHGDEVILNTLPSQGRFSIEHKLLLNENLRGFFCNAKLIGKEDELEYLQRYSKQVMKLFVNNLLVIFTNGQFTIDDFIIQSGDLLDIIIINNEIPISKMPSVQILALLLDHDEVFGQF